MARLSIRTRTVPSRPAVRPARGRRTDVDLADVFRGRGWRADYGKALTTLVSSTIGQDDDADNDETMRTGSNAGRRRFRR
jgi:hypothetical protein